MNRKQKEQLHRTISRIAVGVLVLIGVLFVFGFARYAHTPSEPTQALKALVQPRDSISVDVTPIVEPVLNGAPGTTWITIPAMDRVTIYWPHNRHQPVTGYIRDPVVNAPAHRRRLSSGTQFGIRSTHGCPTRATIVVPDNITKSRQ